MPPSLWQMQPKRTSLRIRLWFPCLRLAWPWPWLCSALGLAKIPGNCRWRPRYEVNSAAAAVARCMRCAFFPRICLIVRKMRPRNLCQTPPSPFWCCHARCWLVACGVWYKNQRFGLKKDIGKKLLRNSSEVCSCGSFFAAAFVREFLNCCFASGYLLCLRVCECVCVWGMPKLKLAVVQSVN